MITWHEVQSTDTSRMREVAALRGKRRVRKSLQVQRRAESAAARAQRAQHPLR